MFKDWRRVSDLGQSGPDDRDFKIDYVTATLTFGNGVNGYVPPITSVFSVSYQVTNGIGGNLPRGLHWSVRTVVGDFGINSDAMTGGGAAEGRRELQSATRRHSRNTRPIVTSMDLQDAAPPVLGPGVNRASVPATERRRSVRGARSCARPPRSADQHAYHPGGASCWTRFAFVSPHACPSASGSRLSVLATCHSRSRRSWLPAARPIRLRSAARRSTRCATGLTSSRAEITTNGRSAVM